MSYLVATIEPWQHSSPGGGFVSTEWLPADKIEPGMVARVRGAWEPIATLEHRLGVGLIATLSNGERLWLLNGLEIRQDLRWDPVPIADCGCWETDSGTWRCTPHLVARRAS